MCLCNLSLKPRDLRRLVEDSEEDPMMPRDPKEI